MLTDSPVARSAGARVLFLLAAIGTVAIRLYQIPGGGTSGLSPIFTTLFASDTYGDYGATVAVLLILVLAALVPAGLGVRRILSWAGAHPLLIAACSALVLCAGTLLVYHDHPLSMDEYAARFQSRIFAAGQLHGSFPPGLVDWLIPRGFQNFFLNVSTATGDVAESYWPGFALLLTPFSLIGLPWLCNPVISALTLLVIHRLALEIFDDREAAGLALLFTAASPVLFGNGVSYYSMPAHLLANSLFALLLVRPNLPRAFAAGVVGSMALSLHNPVPHLLFAVPWLVWIVTRQRGIGLLAMLCAGYLPLCALLGVGWFLFSNHLVNGGTAAMATAPDLMDRLSSLLSVFSLPSSPVLLARLIGLAKIWMWAVPGLLILAIGGAVRSRHSPVCRLFALSALLTLAGYFFVPVDQGHGWGFRYFHSAWMALPLLATAAFYRTGAPSAAPGIFGDGETLNFVSACIVLSLVVGVGYRAWQMQAFVAADLDQLPHYAGTERRVVIIDPGFAYYGADLVQNDPWLRGDVIRMISQGTAADSTMMSRYFPDLHRVFADRHGSVWSAVPAAARAPSSPDSGRR